MDDESPARANDLVRNDSNALNTVYTKPDDMTNDEKMICDDLLIAVSNANGTAEIDGDLDTRHTKLWEKVSSHWDTNRHARHPGKPFNHDERFDSVHIGCWKEDLPPSESAVKEAAQKSTRHLTVHPVGEFLRTRNIYAHMRAVPNFDHNEIAFHVLDHDHTRVSRKFVRYRNNMPYEDCCGLATYQYDVNEAFPRHQVQ
ncbi:hypothetical protein QBC35DRAFT_541093 [Podospora australis]|uniref:Uncharacterized protein n=1 Tax=Podospora australis TaxID=1536484 RepID=A0AAN6WLB5_9PEZI|nr:hypothetical protein QBC35DRAFT_541093 [Podospora australis]